LLFHVFRPWLPDIVFPVFFRGEMIGSLHRIRDETIPCISYGSTV
jgi:hypothetical protein